MLHYLETNRLTPEVICIQESFLKEPKKFHIDGYEELRKDRIETPGGGLISYIKKGIQFKQLEEPQGLECQIFELLLGKKEKITIINVYNPPGNKIDEDKYKILFKNRKAIILGDFNAKNPLWKHEKLNDQGTALEKLIETHQFVVINTGKPTYRKENGGMSILDLAFVSNSLALKCKWDTIEDTLGSDHLPVVISINEQAPIEPDGGTKWNVKKADWPLFKTLCK